MDANGSRSKAIARLLKKLGVQVSSNAVSPKNISFSLIRVLPKFDCFDGSDLTLLKVVSNLGQRTFE